MTKAYDLKSLGLAIILEAKKIGLTLGEEAAEKIAAAAYLGTKKWTIESAAVSPNKSDDFLVQYLNKIDPYILPFIEKIDFDGNGK